MHPQFPHAVDLRSLPMDATISLVEPADTLRRPRGSFRNEVCRGRAPRSLRFGRSVRFRVADVLVWLDSLAKD